MADEHSNCDLHVSMGYLAFSVACKRVSQRDKYDVCTGMHVTPCLG